MKTLNFSQMEVLNGGQAVAVSISAHNDLVKNQSVIGGICTTVGIIGGGVAVRTGMASLGMIIGFSMPVWGQVALATVTVGCAIHLVATR